VTPIEAFTSIDRNVQRIYLAPLTLR
jgi:hypothetical protein